MASVNMSPASWGACQTVTAEIEQRNSLCGKYCVRIMRGKIEQGFL